MISEKLIDNAASYVFDYYKNKAGSHLIFHNYKHVTDVVDACQEIGKAMRLEAED